MKANGIVVVIVNAIALSVGGWLFLDASGMWLDKSGFLWGVLTIFLFNTGVGLVSGAVRGVWNQLVAGGADALVAKLIVLLFALMAGYVGYRLLMTGWSHWWTGFCASVFLGLEGMVVGTVTCFAALCELFMAVLPRSVWGNLVKSASMESN